MLGEPADTGAMEVILDEETKQVLLSRPERITGSDEGLFKRLGGLAAGGRAALVEVAGRDSIAAAVTAAQSGRYAALIPTVVYTGSEFGDWEMILANAASLADRLCDVPGVSVAGETAVLGSPRWWHASAGRYAGELQSRYGFNTTCIACHMYLHAARVPLAVRLGADAVITGERLLHDDRIKVNQLGPALEAYRKVAAGRGITLDMPLEHTSSGKDIGRLTGPRPDPVGQMSCVLEANYRDPDGGVAFEESMLRAYLEEFLVPLTTRVLEALVDGGSAPDYLEIADSVITKRSSY